MRAHLVAAPLHQTMEKQKLFEKIFAHIGGLMSSNKNPVFNAQDHFNGEVISESDYAKRLNAAFLIALTGPTFKLYQPAKNLLVQAAESNHYREIGCFFLEGLERISDELGKAEGISASRLESAIRVLEKENPDHQEIRESLWSIFFPEGKGIFENPKSSVARLRKKRRINVLKPQQLPIRDVFSEMLFTANALLTIPSENFNIDGSEFSSSFINKLKSAVRGNQIYWYDHPIQIGVETERNEVIYGLRNLNDAVEFEIRKRGLPAETRLRCVLSVSVTHRELHGIALPYLKREISRIKPLDHLEIYAFTEDDTDNIIRQVLAPAAKHYLASTNPIQDLAVFGVDGHYGRHYSFLKAVAALWQVLVNPEIRGTFKIDLDQVFPQEQLVRKTGMSAFDHFRNPLWGAEGIDSWGKPVELGMIAGALVNDYDIEQSIFTPDVPFPLPSVSFDEYIFFSRLPQAVSTEAEMMTRYSDAEIDGKSSCIERIHVTGGTNGILVDCLRRFRPFTPSFIGRAEDQAYILSAISGHPKRLAYFHASGLFMRHDKDSFAREAITAAKMGKMIGDYERIALFSAYAHALNSDISKIKRLVDPFTGSFISRTPITLIYLRLCLKTASLFSQSRHREALDFLSNGAHRLRKTLAFAFGEDGEFARTLEKEKRGWNLFYQALEQIEAGIQNRDPFADQLKIRIRKILDKCRLSQ